MKSNAENVFGEEQMSYLKMSINECVDILAMRSSFSSAICEKLRLSGLMVDVCCRLESNADFSAVTVDWLVCALGPATAQAPVDGNRVGCCC